MAGGFTFASGVWRGASGYGERRVRGERETVCVCACACGVRERETERRCLLRWSDAHGEINGLGLVQC